MALIEAERLTYAYPDSVRPALQFVSFAIPAGAWWLLQGPSGSGKSTLLKVLSGACPHFYGGRLTGAVRVSGDDLAGLSGWQRLGWFGFVEQHPEAQAVYETVAHEVAFTLENRAIPAADMEWRVAEALELVGMSGYARSPLHALSGGQRQKVALAAALVHQPKVLLLDEPTAQLDPVATSEWMDILRRLNDDFGTTIVMSEHQVSAAYGYAHEVLYLEEGEVRMQQDVQRAAQTLRTERPEFAPAVARLFVDESPCLTVRVAKDRVSRADATPHGAVGAAGLGGGREDVAPQRPAPPREALIDLRRITSVYDPHGTPALADCSATLVKHGVTALIGPNGSGKSTLLKVLAGLQPIQSGRVRGAWVPRDRRSRFALALGDSRVGYVPQHAADYFSQETVAAELEYPLSLRGWAEPLRAEAVAAAAERFHIQDLLQRHPREVSGGEQLRVAIASASIANPQLLLLDEPTRGLDRQRVAEFGHWLRSGDIDTVVVASHDMEFVADFADRVWFLAGGSVGLQGTPREVFSQALYFTPTVARVFRDVAPDILTLRDAIERGWAQ